MKAEIDTLPSITPEQGKALFDFFVDVIEEQRMRVMQAELSGNVWGTIGQIAKLIGMTSSGASALIARIRAAGFEVRQTDPNAIQGHPMRARYRIGDVQQGLYLLRSINHIIKTLTREKGAKR